MKNTQHDSITCQYCSNICSDDTEIQYSRYFECCEECIEIVESSREETKQHIEYCKTLLF